MKITNLIAIGHILSYNVVYHNNKENYVEYNLMTLRCCNYVVCFKEVHTNIRVRQTHNLIRITELSEFN